MNHSETELMNVKTAFKCPQSVLLLIPPSSRCFLSLVSFIQWLCMSTIFRNKFYLPVPVLNIWMSLSLIIEYTCCHMLYCTYLPGTILKLFPTWLQIVMIMKCLMIIRYYYCALLANFQQFEINWHQHQLYTVIHKVLTGMIKFLYCNNIYID